MRDKFEALYAARMTRRIVTPDDLKKTRVGESYFQRGEYSPKVTGARLGFQLAAAAVKRGDDIQ